MIGRKYRIERKLGHGGMGVVFAATDLALKRAVAIKQLLPSLRSDHDCVARFLREARAAVALTSAHTVRVFDVGEDADGVPFMVMEYLTGGDLGAVVANEGRLPPARAVGYLLQAIEGIADAHVAGIIHRDLKPQNLFLTKGPDGADLVKVLDFGLAKAPIAEGERPLTATSAVMGSPEYMSPEQTRGSRDVDVRTDVWALGACLYELLTGQVPFSASNVSDIIVKILTYAPVPPHAMHPDIPEALSNVVLRCLEKDVATRFPDVGALASALRDFAPPSAEGATERIQRILRRGQSEPIDVLPPLAGAYDAVEQTETKTEAIYDSGPEHKKRRVVWRVAIGAGLLAATIGTVMVYRLPTRSALPAPAPAPAAPASSLTVEPESIVAPSSSEAEAPSASPPIVKSATPHVRPPKKPPPAPTVKRPAPGPAGVY